MKAHKLSGMKEVLSESLKSTIGVPISSDTTQAIKSSTERTLQGLVDAKALSSFEVGKVQTKHQSKKFLGRVADFFLWKTFLKRWYYKPFYVEVGLAERFYTLREHTNFFEDMSDGDFEVLIQRVHAITVWEKRYPENPYSIILSDISIQPVLPAKHIDVSVTL